MTVDDFRRIALSLDGAEEGSHMGQSDFRVGGQNLRKPRVGETGVREREGDAGAAGRARRGNAGSVRSGTRRLGRTGMTHVQLAAASEDVPAGVLRAAWKLRLERNAKAPRKKRRKKQ